MFVQYVEEVDLVEQYGGAHVQYVDEVDLSGAVRWCSRSVC